MSALLDAGISLGTAAISSVIGGKRSMSGLEKAQRDAIRLNTELLKKDRAYYESNYQPLETQLAGMASAAGSEQEQQEAAADVGARIQQGYKGATGELERNMAASGANPADPAYQSTMASLAGQKAGEIGGAQYQAAKGVRDEAFNKVAGVAQIGKGMPGQITSGLATVANQYGNMSVTDNYLRNQQLANSAYALQPVGKALGSYVSDWWTARNPVSTIPTNTVPFNPSQTGVSGDTAKMIGLKTGGIVEQPTVAALAEDGKEEAVLNHGALRLLGKGAVNKLNEMGRMIAQKGARPPVHSLGVA
jgi:hypothetical protein